MSDPLRGQILDLATSVNKLRVETNRQKIFANESIVWMSDRIIRLEMELREMKAKLEGEVSCNE